MADRALELGQRLDLELEIALQNLFYVLADVQPPERLEIRQPIEKQNAFGEPVGMLHLVDRFGAFELGKFVDAPIVEQPVVKPILVGGGQLILERLVKQLDDL